MGEKILIEFSIAENTKDFRGPNFKDFRILSGPNPSTSSSYSFINGKSQSTVNTTYSYALMAKKIGNLTIGSASVNVNGDTYQSRPINIQIVQNKSNKTTQNNKKAEHNINDNQLYIKATTNKRKLYQGEQILVKYKLFTRVDLASTELVNNPALNGFWTQDIKVNSKFKRESNSNFRN